MIFVEALITLSLVPIFIRIAKKMGIVDRPDGLLKTHGREVPYLGGLAMFLGASPILWRDSVVLLSAALATSVGLLDDLLSLSPKLRLAAEFSIAIALTLRFLGFSDPLFSAMIIVGVVALVNAINMVDGMDGMAAGTVAISSLFLYAISENSLAKDISLTTAVISLSFLVYNFPPAKIFMGDAGSYLLGVSLSSVLTSSMRYGWSPKSMVYIFPVWIYGLDLLSGFVRRIRAGRSPFEGDRDHFYDKIKRRVKDDVKTLLISYALTAAFSMASILKPFSLALMYEIFLSALIVWKLNLFSYDS